MELFCFPWSQMFIQVVEMERLIAKRAANQTTPKIQGSYFSPLRESPRPERKAALARALWSNNPQKWYRREQLKCLRVWLLEP